jgi:hypothetical protein
VVIWGVVPTTVPTQYWVPIPVLPPGVVYVEVAGGGDATTLRRSDGQVVVCG